MKMPTNMLPPHETKGSRAIGHSIEETDQAGG